MSDTTENVEGGAPSNNGGAGVELETLQAEIEALKSKNKELMDETKKRGSKLKKYEDEKEALKQEKLKEEGKYKDLLDLSEKKNLEIAEKFKSKVMDTQLEKAALSAGCTNLTAFKKLSRGYQERVKFDENFDADKDSLSTYISEFKEEYKDLSLFEVKTKAPQDGGSGGKPEPEKKTFKQTAIEQFGKMSGHH